MTVTMYVISLPIISGSGDVPDQDERCIFTSDETKAQALVASEPGAVYYPWGVDTFGNEYNYGASDGISSTSSTTYQQKLRLTVSGISGGTYRINWSLEQDTASATVQTGYRVQINDATTLIDTISEKPDKDQYHPSSGFDIETLVSGTYNIDLDYKTNSGGGAGTNIKNVHIDFWRVE